MKRSIIVIVILLSGVARVSAHYLWVQTDPFGELGKEQEVRIYFGEYTYGLKEKVTGEAFVAVKDFTLWVVDDSGKRTELQFVPREDYYLATFTPYKEGTYTIILNNDQIGVIDYSAYDFGIFKTHYHSVAKIQVGEKTGQSATGNPTGLTISNVSQNQDSLRLRVFYKNEILPKHEVTIFVADQWSRSLETDDDGYIDIALPWKDTNYIVEITRKEETPGTFRHKPYEFIWHCVTHYFTR